MKKYILLVALVLLLSMLAVACSDGGEQETTAVPGSTLGVTEEPGETGLEETPFGEATQLATETTVVETPIATDTQAHATETQMPTAVATESAVNATQVVTGTAQLPGTGAIDPNRLSNMLDFEVLSQDGDEIGDVSDMVLNLRNAQVEYVLVDFGGFLGIGERTVAVPWKELTLQTGVDDQTGAEGQNAFVLNADPAMIENAPEFERDLIPGVDEPVDDWDVNFRDFWTSGGVTTTMNMTETPGAVVGTASTTTPEAGLTITQAITGTQTVGINQDNRMGQFVLATDLLGWDIPVNADSGAQMTIEDAIIDPDSGNIQYFIVVLSGMGDHDSWIPVPPSVLVTTEADNIRFVDVNPDVLAGSPGFTEDEFPDTTVSGWDDAFVNWWNQHTDLTTP